jgi:hypothetical protein
MPSRSKKVALGGVLGTLCMICLYAAVYLPINRIFLYGVSSIFCGIILMETGAKWSWTFYIATSALALLIIPNKIGVIPYILFFGLYGIIKYYIEKLKILALELVLKGTYFLLSAVCIAAIIKDLFLGNVYSKFPLWMLGIAGVVIFYLYDYVYSRFIGYYVTRLKKRI